MNATWYSYFGFRLLLQVLPPQDICRPCHLSHLYLPSETIERRALWMFLQRFRLETKRKSGLTEREVHTPPRLRPTRHRPPPCWLLLPARERGSRYRLLVLLVDRLQAV